MIECVFTLDYEIYGDGTGNLFDHVYKPTEKLINIFSRWNTKFVVFVEIAELEMIYKARTDEGIEKVNNQIKLLYSEGYEIGLHLHPQWYNGRFVNGEWRLDSLEYNLCTQPKEKIYLTIKRAINYLAELINEQGYIPLSFRAGNWLFQPSQNLAEVLADSKIKIDSSLYKGGLINKYHIDYRPALKNSYYWWFTRDINIPEKGGRLLEIPIYSKMVKPLILLSRKGGGKLIKDKKHNMKTILSRGFYICKDFCRKKVPMKFDFCKLTLSQMKNMIDEIIIEDNKSPDLFKPIVMIGHTKDNINYDDIDSFLSYLNQRGIPITTLSKALQKCL